MARYTKVRADTIRPGNPVGDFIGWDSLLVGDEACEATHVRDLYRRLSERDARIFDAMSNDTHKKIGGFIYQKHA